jgi:hypothetical protein
MLVGASIGLSYSDTGQDEGPGLIHRVYVQPEAADYFKEHGAFPTDTMFVLELYEPARNAMPARRGFYEGARVGIEASVRDPARFEGGWAYFDFENGARQFARPLPGGPSSTGTCFACHRDHAARDNVFTQFYPALR